LPRLQLSALSRPLQARVVLPASAYLAVLVQMVDPAKTAGLVPTAALARTERAALQEHLGQKARWVLRVFGAGVELQVLPASLAHGAFLAAKVAPGSMVTLALLAPEARLVRMAVMELPQYCQGNQALLAKPAEMAALV